MYQDIFGNLVTYEKFTEKELSSHSQNLRELADGGNRYKGSKFLIHVIKQKVMINDQEHCLTFFRDVRFGVLYE